MLPSTDLINKFAAAGTLANFLRPSFANSFPSSLLLASVALYVPSAICKILTPNLSPVCIIAGYSPSKPLPVVLDIAENIPIPSPCTKLFQNTSGAFANFSGSVLYAW